MDLGPTTFYSGIGLGILLILMLLLWWHSYQADLRIYRHYFGCHPKQKHKYDQRHWIGGQLTSYQDWASAGATDREKAGRERELRRAVRIAERFHSPLVLGTNFSLAKYLSNEGLEQYFRTYLFY